MAYRLTFTVNSVVVTDGRSTKHSNEVSVSCPFVRAIGLTNTFGVVVNGVWKLKDFWIWAVGERILFIKPQSKATEHIVAVPTSTLGISELEGKTYPKITTIGERQTRR
jgi:hypothetical protein